MKYKVTPRGWVVFSIVGLLLLYGIFASLRWMFFEDSLDAVGQIENTNIENELTNDSKTESDDDNIPNEEENKPSEDQDSGESENDGSDEEDDSDEENHLGDVILITKEEITMIYYDKNIANFTDSHKEVIQKWIDWLKADSTLEIIVEGHINGYPYYDDGTFGLEISKKRAEVVKEYIINQGIDGSRIQIKNMGSTDQAILTDDLSKHYLNRRAIIYFK
jgi:outer membrane protein OmpA-like peptidoglycan-associated protein